MKQAQKPVHFTGKGWPSAGKPWPFSGKQSAALFFLVIISIFFFVHPEPYTKVLEENLNPACFDFLREGDYTLEITYEKAAGGTRLLLYSEEMTDEHNNRGILYAERELEEGSGILQLPLSLECPSYGVCVRMESASDTGGYLTRVGLQSNRLIYKDNYLLCGLTLLFAGLLAFLFRKINNSSTAVQSGPGQNLFPGYPDRYILPIILTGMGLLASLPLFSDSIVPATDFHFHLTRIESIYRSLAAGDFPVRITSRQIEGYGSLAASMYPQLFLYPAALLRFLDASLMLSFKLLLAAINIAAAFTSYYGAKNICRSPKAGLWMSIFYTFSLYRLTNIYIRGALGESLAMVFLPLIMWGVYEIFLGKRRWFILVLGMTGVLNSHDLTTEMSALFMAAALLCWLLSKKKDQFGKRFLDGCKAAAVTLVLNAFFLVPFFFFCSQDLQCFHIEYEIYEHAAYFSQMFSLFPSVESPSLPLGTTQFEMPLTIGGSLLAGVILFLAVSGKTADSEKRDAAGFHCFLLGTAAVLMSSWIFPWERVGELPLLSRLFSSLQFPWRFLGPASAFWSLTAAAGMADLAEQAAGEPILPAFGTASGSSPAERTVRGKELISFRWACGVLAVLTLVSAGYLFDSLAQKRYQCADTMSLEGQSSGDSMYLYYEGTQYRAIHDDYYRSDMYIKTRNQTSMEFSAFRKDGSRIHVEVTPAAEGEDILMFPLYWYPGYEIRVNGESVPVFSCETLVSCNAPKEKAVIDVRYRGFWFFGLADAVSAVTVSGILGTGLYRYKKRRKSRQ